MCCGDAAWIGDWRTGGGSHWRDWARSTSHLPQHPFFYLPVVHFFAAQRLSPPPPCKRILAWTGTQDELGGKGGGETFQAFHPTGTKRAVTMDGTFQSSGLGRVPVPIPSRRSFHGQNREQFVVER